MTRPTETRRNGSKPGRGRKLLFALLPLVGLIAVAEVGLRAFAWPHGSNIFLHQEVYWVFDPDLVESPVQHREEGTSFHVTTNPDGLRTAYTREKREGRTRILTLGCSTTFGWGVEDQETWPARLEQSFERDGPDVEVVNGGQPGYTTFQGLWLWENVLRHYEPDLVILGYIAQDSRFAAYSDKSQAILEEEGRFLKEHFLYRSKTYLAIDYILEGLQKEESQGADHGPFGDQRVSPEDYEANLRSLVGSIRALGADVVFVTVPLFHWSHTIRHREVLTSLAAELQVEFFDPQEKMEQLESRRDLYFDQDDGHANADGNDRIAQWLYADLREYRGDW